MLKIDITESVQRYRLALRHIWNASFWADPNLRNWESVYSFRELKLPLFSALIAAPLHIEAGDTIFGPAFHVVPYMEDGAGLPSLQVNSRVPSSPTEGIWETLKGPFKADDIKVTLVDHFDWSPLGYLDLRYYVVMIEAFNSYPDKVGQHALVDVAHAGVFWTTNEGQEIPDNRNESSTL